MKTNAKKIKMWSTIFFPLFSTFLSFSFSSLSFLPSLFPLSLLYSFSFSLFPLFLLHSFSFPLFLPYFLLSFSFSSTPSLSPLFLLFSSFPSLFPISSSPSLFPVFPLFPIWKHTCMFTKAVLSKTLPGYPRVLLLLWDWSCFNSYLKKNKNIEIKY